MKRTVGMAVSLALLLMSPSIASAEQPQDLPAQSKTSQTTEATPQVERPLGAQHLEDRLNAVEPLYSDREVAELTVFGFGKAAEMDPELARLFRTNNPQQIHPTEEQVTFVYDKLIEKIPDYHDQVSLKLQSGDPYLTKEAILTTAQALREIEEEYNRTSGQGQYTPYGWHDTHAYVELNGAAVLNAAVYANIAVATEVAIVLYVVPGAISYQFPMMANTLDGDLFIAQLCEQFKQ